MKKVFIRSTTLYLLSFLFVMQAFGQVIPPNADWVVRYNGPANKTDNVREIVVDDQNNIYVTGLSQNKNGNSIATVKYNSGGVQKWAARYSGPKSGDNYPYGLATDADGNVYVTGRSEGNGTGIDIVTIKYDSSGVQKWAVRYNGSANLNDVPGDLKVNASGKVFVTGYTNSTNLLGPAPAIVTIAYKADGTQDWVRLYDQLPNNGAGTNEEEGVSLALDGTGNIYVTGTSAGMVTIKYDPSGQPVWARTIAGGNGRKVLIDAANNVLVSGWSGKIGKYDSNGTLLWQTTPSLPTASFSDMALDGAGNVYVIGICNGINDRSDYVTAKYNTDLTEQWIKSYNGSLNSTDIGRSIALDGSGNVYVTGYSSVNNGSRNGGLNYGTIKYNNNGVQQWLALYDSPDKNGSHAFGVVVDAAGNIYVTGESATKATSSDYTTIKYSQGNASKASFTNPLQEKSTISKFELRNYPNPFSKNTTIEYQLVHEGKVKLSVFDLSGHEIATLVNEYKPAGIYKINFKTNKLPAGTYFYRIQAGKYIETKKLIILR